MTRQHEDFIYQAEPASPVTPSSSQQAKNDLAHRAASASYKIRSSEPDPKRWGPLIQALPDEIRDCAREYLAQHYRSMKDRERIAAGGKRSATGDA